MSTEPEKQLLQPEGPSATSSFLHFLSMLVLIAGLAGGGLIAYEGYKLQHWTQLGIGVGVAVQAAFIAFLGMAVAEGLLNLTIMSQHVAQQTSRQRHMLSSLEKLSQRDRTVT